MKKRSSHGLFLVITLMTVLVASTQVPKVAAPYPTIFIKADGSIDPPTANITSADNITYTFTADINAFIVVEKNATVVNGAHFTVQGPGSGLGIDLSYTNNVTLQNVKVSDFSYGISLTESSHNTIIGNTASYNFEGIFLNSSSGNTVTGNTASNNTYGIYLLGSSNNTVTGNTASANGYDGIGLYHSSNNNIVASNTASSNQLDGIGSVLSFNNTIADNTASNNQIGIGLSSSSNNNTVTGNTASANGYVGIGLSSSSSNNIIASNTASNNNYDGIGLYHSSNNTVMGNTVSNNGWYGIQLLSSNSNVLFHNNLFGNLRNVGFGASSGNVEAWDDGVEGNYWSNYTGADANHDGIGDTPHVIDANNADYYPLMGMFHSFNTSVGDYVDIISNSTVDGFQCFASNTTIRLRVSNTTVSQTHGFCRIRMPYEIMSPPFTVTVDGANPTYWNYTLYDDGASRWIYFEYEHSTRDIVVIPEFPFAAILPFLLALSLLVTIAYQRKQI